jgi:hypothetical protein
MDVADWPWYSQLEYETESGFLPAETITGFLQLGRVALGELEKGSVATTIELELRNTGEQPMFLDLDHRFFSLEDDRGLAGELVYFCCPAEQELLAPGRGRTLQLVFQLPPGALSKEGGANAIILDVRGLRPIIRASWQIILPQTAA